MKDTMIKPNLNKVFRLNIISVLSFISLLSLNVNAEENNEHKITKNDFRYFSNLKTYQLNNKLYGLHIGSDLIEKSENNLNDIRIYDSKDTETPYILLDDYKSKAQEITYNLKITDYSSQNKSEQIIGKMPDKRKAINHLIFNTENVDFNKNIKLYGSDDSKNWKLISEQNIYDFSSKIPLRKTEIKFSPVNYQYYKIAINKDNSTNNQSLQLKYKELNLNINSSAEQNFHIGSILAATPSGIEDDVVFDNKVFSNLAVTNENHKSVIKLDANLPFDKIDFSIDNPYYYRKVNVYFADKDEKEDYKLLNQDSLYKIPMEKNEERNELKYHVQKHRFYKFEIENNDNPPLKLNQIKLSWVRKNLFFMEQPGSSEYKLYLGNKNVSSPAYDFSTYVNQDNWFNQNYQEIKNKNIEINQDFKDSFSNEDKDKLQQNILIIIVCIISLILGFWIYRMVKDTPVKSE